MPRMLARLPRAPAEDDTYNRNPARKTPTMEEIIVSFIKGWWWAAREISVSDCYKCDHPGLHSPKESARSTGDIQKNDTVTGTDKKACREEAATGG